MAPEQKSFRGNLSPDSIFSDSFRRRTYDIHDYDTRSKDRLSIDKVNLELTKRAFFYKGATLFNDCM